MERDELSRGLRSQSSGRADWSCFFTREDLEDCTRILHERRFKRDQEAEHFLAARGQEQIQS